MSDVAVRVRNLSKQYAIGILRHDTLRDHLSHLAKRLVRKNQKDGSVHKENRIWALKDVSFDVEVGEVIGVIGRNGAGKSTLLKILSRITEPTSGYIEIKSRIGSLLEVGTGFHPELTGRENIFLNGAILGMKKAEIIRKFDEIVAFAEIERFLDTPVKRYSSGMYVRLAFAVAAHLEPDILVVDEVLSVGDAAFQKKCIGKMSGIAREGRTVLFVSHNLLAVQSLCRSGILLQDGHVVTQGLIEDVIRAYSKTVDSAKVDQSLADRTDRENGTKLRIVAVEFLDALDKSPQSLLLSGQDVLIRLHWEYTGDKPLEDVSFAISFYETVAKVPLFGCRSDAIGVLYRVGPGHGSCACRVKKWPLSGGIYSYNVNASKDKAFLDRVTDAGEIRVENGDYYGTGKLPKSLAHCVFIDFDWEPRPEPEY